MGIAIKILAVLLITIMICLVLVDTGRYARKGKYFYACIGIIILIFLVISIGRIAIL